MFCSSQCTLSVGLAVRGTAVGGFNGFPDARLEERDKEEGLGAAGSAGHI